LVDAAKQAGYFDNTIFVITADHANEFTEQTETIPNQFHIPLLLVGPGVTAGIDQRIGSQFDILPTVIDLAGWSTAYAGMGRSLLDESRQSERASLSIRGDILDWITDDGWLSHNLERRVGSSAELTKPQSDLMEHRLLGVYQTTIQAQVNNRFLPTAE
jgi:phosphoglycerol transferase MdoB-like AlkP superfamily enzyme